MRGYFIDHFYTTYQTSLQQSDYQYYITLKRQIKV